MHGLGNDYVYIDVFEQRVAAPEALARAVSDRHRGIGGDGLILIAPPRTPDGDVRMVMYNADGSRAQMCGNGVRCVARYAYEHGRARRNPIRVETDRGVLPIDLTLDPSGRVAAARVDMGEPILDPRRIPVALDGARVVGVPIPLGAQMPVLTAVSMGNPHAVFFVDDLEMVPLIDVGPKLERHPLFPERINVHFVQVLSRDRLRMATWERGTGPTQACGTGAAAVCVAGVLNGFTNRAIVATLPGGELTLVWDEKSNHVFKTGPATEVFSGEWPLDE